MTIQELTWKRTASIWWLLTWRTLVGSLFLGVVFGAIAGVIAGLLGHGEDGGFWGGVAGQFAALVVFPFVLRMGLRKQYKTFSIKIVPTE